MKLSEAMMLGDSLRSRDATCFLDMGTTPPCGCAIGGAALALGQTEQWAHRQLFPWLLERAERGQTNFEGSIGCWEGVGHPSFFGVMAGDYTFEQLVDYVRSIEPSCGECNEFACKCVQKMDETPTLQLQEVTQ